MHAMIACSHNGLQGRIHSRSYGDRLLLRGEVSTDGQKLIAGNAEWWCVAQVLEKR